jgi:homoserine dehydrogenase
MMAMLSYRSQPSFEQRFGRRAQTEELFAVESYLRYQGQQLVDRFDAATYVTLTRAMDTHDVSRGRGDFDDVLRSIRQPMLVVSIDSDVLYWPWEQREVAALAPNARLAVMDSPHGHDAFLIDVDRLSDMVVDFRGEPRRRAAAGAPGAVDRVYAEKGISLLVLGKGKVGAELLEGIRAQRTELERDYDVVLRVVGVADRRGALVDEGGVDLDRWREQLAAAPAAGPVTPETAPALLDALARHPRPILVDLTAAEGMEDVYEQAFRRGIDVVAANKRPLAIAPRRLEALRHARRHHHRRWLYETAVGASLPVIGTLRRLVAGGDRVRAIVGSLSGTLGYLCTELAKGVPLSLATRWAMGLGYCEEDPRDDLSGRDAARKAVILARELGAAVSLEDVAVVPFVPGRLLGPGSPDALLAALRTHDEAALAEVRRLHADGRALRYLARIEPGADGAVSVRVGPEGVDAADPAARLVGVEALVAFTTARHPDRPVVVQGTGVGGANTAGGVLAEILRLFGQGAR